MSLWSKIFGPREPVAEGAKTKDAPPPNLTGRVSKDSSKWSDMMSSIVSGYHWLSASYPFEVHRILDELFKYDPNCRKYEADTIHMGNPGHQLVIDAPNEKRAKEAIQAANDFAARCFPYAGGLDGLFNGILSQVARSGGMCVEWVPDEHLTQVQRGYLVPVQDIRFRKTKQGELELGQLQDGEFVALNMVQTSFLGVLLRDSNPYPIPPALSALQSLSDHKKIHGSLRRWFKKLGVLGFLELIFQRPRQGQESDEEYRKRAGGILNDLATNVKEHLDSGIVVGFDDLQSKFTNTSAGAAGVKPIAQLFDEDLFAGLTRDPTLFGRSFTRAESWSKVAMEMFAGEIRNVQRPAKRCGEHGHRLNFALQGLGDIGVSIRFHEPRSLTGFLDSEAERMKGDGYRADYEAGIADRDEVRKRLGYDDQAAQAGAFIASFVAAENRYHLEPYHRKRWSGAELQGASNDTVIPVDHSGREAKRAARSYLFEITGHLSDAALAGVRALLAWARSRDIPEEEIFVQEALEQFRTGTERKLNSRTLEKIAKKHLKTIWKWARHDDDSVFGPDFDRKSRGTGVRIGVADTNAIKYLSRVDRFYASKFVSDDKAHKEISNFLRQQYLEQGFGTGANKKQLAKFEEAFGDYIEGYTEHRARVIIDTGVSRCQNWGSTIALHAQAIQEMRATGVWDSTTCDYCWAIQPHRFKVAVEYDRIERLIANGNEEIGNFDPFLTSRYSGKEGLKALKALTTEEIQATGMVLPAHPQCRHRWIAVIVVKGKNTLAFLELPSLVEELGWREAA